MNTNFKRLVLTTIYCFTFAAIVVALMMLSFPVSPVQAQTLYVYNRNLAWQWIYDNRGPNPPPTCTLLQTPDPLNNCRGYPSNYIAGMLYAGGIFNIADPTGDIYDIDQLSRIVAWMNNNPNAWMPVLDQSQLRRGDFVLFTDDDPSLVAWNLASYGNGAVVITDDGQRFAGWNYDVWDVNLGYAMVKEDQVSSYAYPFFVHVLLDLTASVGNYVWEDTIPNGFQDPSELGVPNIPINLYRADNTLVAQTTTDNIGFYTFNFILSNETAEYYLAVDRNDLLSRGYDLTTQNQDQPLANDSADSDFDQLTGRTGALTFPATPFRVRPNEDLGLIKIPDCETPQDIVLIMDGSGSITPENFALMKEFMSNIVRAFEISSDQTRLGVVQLNATSVTRIEISLATYNDADQLIDAILAIPRRFRSDGTTGSNISRSLILARSDLISNKRAGVLGTVILISDGGYTEKSYSPNPASAAASVRGQGIPIFMVKFTLPPTDPYYDEAERWSPLIPSEPLDFYYYRDIGDQSDLITKLPRIVQFICQPPAFGPQRNYFTTHTPTLTWNRTNQSQGYSIQIDDSSDFATPILTDDTIPSNQLEYTTPWLDNGMYYWRIQSKGANGLWSIWSIADSFVIDAP